MWSRDPRCSGLNAPKFETDPAAWYAWYDSCNVTGGGSLPTLPCVARRWIDARGGCWEQVCTHQGPEIRPCPRGIRTAPTGPQIISLRVTGTGYVVQIATGQGVSVQEIPLGQVELGQLAGAMLNRSKLPNPQIRRIPHAFWARQKVPAVRTLEAELTG
jgi:hypothetical protein